MAMTWAIENDQPVPEFPRQKHAIIGSYRSGTFYAFRLLERLGASVKHESDRKNDSDQEIIVSGEAVSRSSLAGVPNIYHQVRDPIKAISSAQTLEPAFWRRASKLVSIEIDDPLPVLSASCWLRWNELCEKIAHKRYRVEQIQDDNFFAEWCSWFGVVPDYVVRDGLKTTTNTRSGRYRELTYDDIAWYNPTLADKIKAKGREYGYEIP